MGRLLVIIFLALFIFVFSKSYGIDNLISQDVVKNFTTNSSFENGTPPHIGNPKTSLTVVSSPVRSGFKAGRFLSTTATGTTATLFTDSLPVGDTYDTYFYFRTNTATTTIQVKDEFDSPMTSFEIHTCLTWCKSQTTTLLGGKKYKFFIEGITDVYLEDIRTEKSPALGSVLALDPIVSSSVSGGVQVSCKTASGSQSGCLSSSDWTFFNQKLSVNVTNPKIDDIVKWNGFSWYNGRNSQTVGQSTDYFPDSAASDITDYETILKYPRSASQTVVTVTATNTNATLIKSFATGFQIGSSGIIEAGTWEFDTYGFSSLTSGDTYFRYIVYARSTLGVETELFRIRSGDFDLSDASQPYLDVTETVQPQFTVNATDRIIIKYYAMTDSPNSPNLSLVYNGNNFYSHIRTPITGHHNDQSGLQGGLSDERYHLSLAQLTLSQNPQNGVLNGYNKLTYAPLTATDTIISSIGKLEGRFDSLGGGLAGTGDVNYIPKFTASSIVGNSSTTDDGSIVKHNAVDLGINSSKFFYLGDSASDNTIRFSNNTGVLIIEKRVSGSWVEIIRFDNN